MRKKIIMGLVLMFLLSLAGCNNQSSAPPPAQDASNAEAAEATCSHEELGYEWSGIYNLETEDTYTLLFEESDDASCNIAFLLHDGAMDDIAHMAIYVMEAGKDTINPGEHFDPRPDYAYTLLLNAEGSTFSFTPTISGEYVLFLEHFPQEFNLSLVDSTGNELEARNPVEYEDAHDH